MGKQLMDVANDILMNIQHQIGGGIIYLDCEDREKLKNFYVGENFQMFGERFSEEDNQKYVQYMRFFLFMADLPAVRQRSAHKSDKNTYFSVVCQRPTHKFGKYRKAKKNFSLFCDKILFA